MQDFITAILGENTQTFTPTSVMTIFVICLVLECISSIASNIRKGGMS